MVVCSGILSFFHTLYVRNFMTESFLTSVRKLYAIVIKVSLVLLFLAFLHKFESADNEYGCCHIDNIILGDVLHLFA